MPIKDFRKIRIKNNDINNNSLNDTQNIDKEIDNNKNINNNIDNKSIEIEIKKEQEKRDENTEQEIDNKNKDINNNIDNKNKEIELNKNVNNNIDNNKEKIINKNINKELDDKEKVELFKRYLDLIENIELRKFIIYVLLKAPESFYTLPASVSGKYHPIEHTKKGGLVKHIIGSLKIAECFLSRKKFEDVKKDIVYSALILHDIGKYNGYKNHEIVGYNFVLQQFKDYENSYNKELKSIYDDVDFMLYLIATHMGEFGIEKEKLIYYQNSNDKEKIEKYAMIVQMADYISSRRDVIIL